MAIYMGAININKIRVGGNSVAKMYVGDKLVYTSVPPLPPLINGYTDFYTNGTSLLISEPINTTVVTFENYGKNIR